MKNPEKLTVYNAKTDKELLEILHKENYNSILCAVAFKRFSEDNYIYTILEYKKFEVELCLKALRCIRDIRVALDILDSTDNDSRVRELIIDHARRMIESKK